MVDPKGFEEIKNFKSKRGDTDLTAMQTQIMGIIRFHENNLRSRHAYLASLRTIRDRYIRWPVIYDSYKEEIAAVEASFKVVQKKIDDARELYAKYERMGLV